MTELERIGHTDKLIQIHNHVRVIEDSRRPRGDLAHRQNREQGRRGDQGAQEEAREECQGAASIVANPADAPEDRHEKAQHEHRMWPTR